MQIPKAEVYDPKAPCTHRFGIERTADLFFERRRKIGDILLPVQHVCPTCIVGLRDPIELPVSKLFQSAVDISPHVRHRAHGRGICGKLDILIRDADQSQLLRRLSVIGKIRCRLLQVVRLHLIFQLLHCQRLFLDDLAQRVHALGDGGRLHLFSKHVTS